MDMATLDDDPEMRQIYAWWRDRAGPGPARMPMLSHLEEIELLNHGFMSLVEVGHDPLEFRYRLVSRELSRHLGYEMSGKLTEAIPEPQARAYVERLYERAVRAQAPVYDRGELTLDGRRWSHRTLVLPLSSAGSVVDRLLVFRLTTPPAPTDPPRDAARNAPEG